MHKYLLLLLLLISFSNINASDIHIFKSKTEKENILSKKQINNFDFAFIEALKYKLIGNKKLAIKWFKKCLKIDKSSAAVRGELASIYYSNNDIKKAISYLEDAVYYNNNNRWYKLELSRLYYKREKIFNSCKVLHSLYTENNEDISILYLEASYFSDFKKWKQALKVYNFIEKERGSSLNLSLLKIKILSNLKYYDEINNELEKLYKINPKNLEYYALLANLYSKNNKEEEALEVYKKIIDLNSKDAYPYLFMADFYKKKLDIISYKKYLSIAVEKDNIDSSFMVKYLINLLVNNEDLDIEKSYIHELVNKLISLHPENVYYLALNADLYRFSKKFTKARDIYIKICKLSPYIYKHWESLILLDSEIDDYTSLLKHTSKAIDIFPEHILPYVLKSQALLISERYSDIIGMLDNMDGLHIQNKVYALQLLIFRGEALYGLNKVDDAFNVFDAVLTISPDEVGVLNNYSYYLSLRSENLHKAEKMIQKCLKLKGDDPTYLDTYAWVLFKMKKYKQALFYMKRLLNVEEPTSGEVLEHLGDIYYMNNLKKEALIYWNKALNKSGSTKLLERKIKEEKYFK